MPLCGAKTRAGGECQRSGMANGRCMMHGGKTPETNQNAVKHGFYSNCYTDEEKTRLPDLKHGTLLAELEIARTQLRRAASAKEFNDDGKTRNEHYRPDVIERLLNTVGRLEKQHAEITANSGDTDGLDWQAIAKVGAYLTEEVDSIKISRRAAPSDNGEEKV